VTASGHFWPGTVRAIAAKVISEAVIASIIDSSAIDIRAELGQHLARLWRYGWVLSRQRHVADDLVQATCVRALERAAQFAPGTRLDRWLLTIMHSIWLNEVRAQRVRQGQGFVDAQSELSFDGEQHAQSHVLASQVIKRVNALPEAMREAVFLAYVEGLSYREVAEVLNIPMGTVMSRLATARLKLAEAHSPSAASSASTGDRR
jgi:RNA polymerase sigma-70 factor (ECF subfamily)